MSSLSKPHFNRAITTCSRLVTTNGKKWCAHIPMSTLLQYVCRSVTTFLRPIYTIRLVVYDFDPGVCDRINTRTNVMFQISPSTNEQWNEQKNVGITLVVIRQNDNRVDRPLRVLYLFLHPKLWYYKGNRLIRCYTKKNKLDQTVNYTNFIYPE